jgi:hypothetical protein
LQNTVRGRCQEGKEGGREDGKEGEREGGRKEGRKMLGWERGSGEQR